MNQFSTEYLVPDGTRSDDIKSLITGQRRIAEDPERSLERAFYDTFDWALYLAGIAFERRQCDAHPVLVLHDLRGREAGLSLEFDGQPGFAWDLPEGALRDSVEPLLMMRRLLPVITVESRIQTLRILNEDEKTIARLIIEENRYRGDAARGVRATWRRDCGSSRCAVTTRNCVRPRICCTVTLAWRRPQRH